MIENKIHKKLTINAVSNLSRYVVYILVTFLITPYVIKSLGISLYGLWVLVLSIVGYSGLLEMGIQTAVVKMVSECRGSGDIRQLNEIIMTAFVFFFMTGLLAASICWFVIPYFMYLLVPEPSSLLVAKEVVVIIGFNFTFLFFGHLFSGILQGLQHYHIISIIGILYAVINAILTYGVLSLRYGITAIAVLKVITDFFYIATVSWFAWRKLPDLKFDLRIASLMSFRQLFSIGGKVFVSSSAARLASNVEPMMITYFLSTAWTAIFSIPKRLLDYLKEISWSVSLGFMPLFSELKGRKDSDLILSIYFQYTRYIMILTLPMIALCAVYGDPFIRLWVGDEFAEKGKMLVYILSAAFAVEALQPLLWRFFIGYGKLNVLVKVSSYSSLAYVVLGACMLWAWGINGLALCQLMVTVVNQMIYLAYSSRIFGISMLRQFRICQFTPLMVAGVYTIVLVWMRRILPPSSYFDLLIHVVMLLPVYGVMTLMTLKRGERALLAGKVSGYLSHVRG